MIRALFIGYLIEKISGRRKAVAEEKVSISTGISREEQDNV